MAAELRSLPNAELFARSQKSVRPPDESLALTVVRDFGQPNELAARQATAARNFSNDEWLSYFPGKTYRPTFPGLPQPEPP
jgi:hypothetical protein